LPRRVTLVAVPDAVHRGWLAPARRPLVAARSSPLDHPEWWRWLDCNAPKPQPAPGTPLGGGGFIDCGLVAPVDAPMLTATAPTGGTYESSGGREKSTDLNDPTDVLQEATRPDFSDAAQIAIGTPGHVTIYGRGAGDLLLPRPPPDRRAHQRLVERRRRPHRRCGGLDERYPRRLRRSDAGGRPHRAGDDVRRARRPGGVLSLPMHYDERQAVAHPSRLRWTRG